MGQGALHWKSVLREQLKWPAVFYIIFGSLLLLIILLTINTYVFHLKVETAVVNAAMETITPPVQGIISQIYVKPGQSVKKNDPLAQIQNVELQKELQMAKVDLEDAKLKIVYLEQLLQNEQQRVHVYQHVGKSRLTEAKAKVDGAYAEFQFAKNSLARMQKLHNKRYLSDADWDTIKAKLQTAQEKLTSMTAARTLEEQSLKSVKQGMYFTGNKLEGQENDLLAELATAKKKLTLAADRAGVYEKLTENLILRAPYAGKVLHILRTAGNSTDTSKPILLLEQAYIPKFITAYLTQNEIMQVRLNSPATIYIPATMQTFKGKVIEINRTAGFVDEIKAQYRARNLYVDRTALVTIEIETKSQALFTKEISAGLPAIIYLTRKLTFF